MLTRLGFAGDVQADPTVHGGPTRAAYAYSIEHYPVWERFLGRAPLPHGQFGENLTTRGWTETRRAPGRRVRARPRARAGHAPARAVLQARDPHRRPGDREGVPRERACSASTCACSRKAWSRRATPSRSWRSTLRRITMADYIAAQYAADAPRELVARVAAAAVGPARTPRARLPAAWPSSAPSPGQIAKRGAISRSLPVRKNPAASYSPTVFQLQYHRRWRA